MKGRWGIRAQVLAVCHTEDRNPKCGLGWGIVWDRRHLSFPGWQVQDSGEAAVLDLGRGVQRSSMPPCGWLQSWRSLPPERKQTAHSQ